MAQKPHSLEVTKILREMVFHYTCNPPEQPILDRNGIRAIGTELGCTDPREVLLIPHEVYERHGCSVRPTSIQATSEYLLRRLDENSKRPYRKSK